MKQFVDEILWGIIENFYHAQLLFNRTHKSYEKKIEDFCKEKKISPTELAEQLSIEEGISLIDHNKLIKLKLSYLRPLRSFSQQFQYINSSHDLLYQLIQNMYHEFSIFNGEVHRLKVSALQWKFEKQKKHLSDSIYITLPMKLSRLANMFKNTKLELENNIAYYRENKVVIRSLFLFGEEIIAPLYQNGFNDFLERIYPGVLPELCLRACDSFFQSGFHSYAQDAYQRFVEIQKSSSAWSLSADWQRKLTAITSSHSWTTQA